MQSQHNVITIIRFYTLMMPWLCFCVSNRHSEECWQQRSLLWHKVESVSSSAAVSLWTGCRKHFLRDVFRNIRWCDILSDRIFQLHCHLFIQFNRNAANTVSASFHLFWNLLQSTLPIIPTITAGLHVNSSNSSLSEQINVTVSSLNCSRVCCCCCCGWTLN